MFRMKLGTGFLPGDASVVGQQDDSINPDRPALQFINEINGPEKGIIGNNQIASQPGLSAIRCAQYG